MFKIIRMIYGQIVRHSNGDRESVRERKSERLYYTFIYVCVCAYSNVVLCGFCLDFILGLLNNVGTHINPCRLIRVRSCKTELFLP